MLELTPETIAENRELLEKVHQILRICVSPRNAEIFLAYTCTDSTLAELGAKHDIHWARVRQIVQYVRNVLLRYLNIYWNIKEV